MNGPAVEPLSMWTRIASLVRVTSMIRALVDTNVLFDYLTGREPFYAPARKLMIFANMGDYELWMSSSQMVDLISLLSPGGGIERTTAEMSIRKLRRVVRVCTIGADEVDKALESQWSDFEDALVYQAAMSVGARCIVTRNERDFALSSIPVFDCDGFFKWMEEKSHLSYELVDF